MELSKNITKGIPLAIACVCFIAIIFFVVMLDSVEQEIQKTVEAHQVSQGQISQTHGTQAEIKSSGTIAKESIELTPSEKTVVTQRIQAESPVQIAPTVDRTIPIFYRIDESKLATMDPSVRADYAALRQQFDEYAANWTKAGGGDVEAWNAKMNDLQGQFAQTVGASMDTLLIPGPQSVQYQPPLNSSGVVSAPQGAAEAATPGSFNAGISLGSSSGGNSRSGTGAQVQSSGPSPGSPGTGGSYLYNHLLPIGSH